ncbi:MAG: response regulator [Pseudomonadales bacterium]|nr:response regulator [Pseudomonadales bacterium]
MSKNILFVDDESNVLDAYRRNLRKQFNITTATSGAEGLTAIQTQGPFAVIVSDMRMPEMDGVEFLIKAKSLAPDTIRMMLTGNADQQTAIDAVNKGDVFRFLNKPCSPEDMAHSLSEAVKQYQLINAEKAVLENTLKASIETLAEVLSLISPDVFGRTTRIKRYMLACAKLLGLPNLWEFESAALMSQMGCVTLPEELTKKALSLSRLNEEELEQYNRHPLLGAQLIAKIPRMERVADSIKYQHKYYDGSGSPADAIQGEDIPIGARILRVLLDYDLLETAGLRGNAALEKLKRRGGKYDPTVLAAFEQFLNEELGAQEQEVSVTQLNDAMILAEDVITKGGTLLMCKGQQTSESVAERLTNFWHNGAIDNKVKVFLIKNTGDEEVTST